LTRELSRCQDQNYRRDRPDLRRAFGSAETSTKPSRIARVSVDGVLSMMPPLMPCRCLHRRTRNLCDSPCCTTDVWLHIVRVVSAVGSPARAGTVCPRFHLMFALTHFPMRTSTCSLQYIEHYLHSQYYSRSTSYSHITQLLPWLTRGVNAVMFATFSRTGLSD
jgi:hypothetical protein